MEPFIGQIMLFGGNFVIKGWQPCDGRLQSIAQNSALFSILGVSYGGDGKTTFALPKIANVGESVYLIAVEGVYPSRT